ncbi:unnamed protein product [Paramecium pentaurelia]|uniref:Transmembrane protein n=1 Tax=Paramecium pentaurelia TaxID=43138 RepID=A0A8S1UJ40_9CILI|nr:unnamed protein product [Paramecium pentaurelia]
MFVQISSILLYLLFIHIPISFGDALSKQSNICRPLDQPSKVFSFDESKLYYIKNKKGTLCFYSFLRLNEFTNQNNDCLFKFKHIEHGYYTIQIFSTDLYIGIDQKSLADNQFLNQFSLPIDTLMQFKFLHVRDGWYEVIVRRTSSIWSFSINYSNEATVFQTQWRIQGINQLFRAEQYND